ncbi:hypothetical protein Tco_0415913 [Tanacetum coccineum]
MEIPPVSASDSITVLMVEVHTHPSVVKATCSYSKLKSIQDYLKAKDQDIKIKIKDPRSQACKRNFKGIPKSTRFQDLRRHMGEAISAMTTP